METMNEYKSKADNAVTTGNAVLQDAEQTLKTLQGKFICNVLMHWDVILNSNKSKNMKWKLNWAFLSDFDQTFLDSKTKAEEALRTVDDIDEMVRIAYAKTQEAMTAMQVKSRDKQVSDWVNSLAYTAFM